jgi:bifunctional UDP-N-acetylglucosamine pyrophosphorylase/glucosamine-1-phosphate N-acetyltransferase
MPRERNPISREPPGQDTVLVVLAAGQGTRMRSALPKPLHPVAGLPMVSHVLRAGAGACPSETVLVVGGETRDLADRLGFAGAVRTVVQEPARGTGDAVRCALAAVATTELVVVLYADHPLLLPETVAALVAGARREGARVTLLTTVLPDGAGYGRIERDEAGRPRRIVERADDAPEQRVGPTEINSGMMALDAGWARRALADLQPSAATGEFYLTELVQLAVAEGRAPGGAWPVATVAGEPAVALGINDRADLAAADAVARDRVRRQLMRDGVTLIGPETIFVDAEVAIGRDTTILPFSTLGVGSVVGAGCVIGPQATIARSRLGDGVVVRASTVEDSTIGDEADVGPYAHLRAGTEIGPRAHVGNYAELKNTRLGEGVKVGHVSYLGDATVGAGSNIGAGTITANYDGVAKHPTAIGERAFIGSDTILRAPVRVGAGARTGAGAVVTRDVPDGATVVGVPARVVSRGVEESRSRGVEGSSNGAREDQAD